MRMQGGKGWIICGKWFSTGNLFFRHCGLGIILYNTFTGIRLFGHGRSSHGSYNFVMIVLFNNHYKSRVGFTISSISCQLTSWSLECSLVPR
ncbi:hypothetical protein ACLB2K_006968 [Fragaria x ananassa]